MCAGNTTCKETAFILWGTKVTLQDVDGTLKYDHVADAIGRNRRADPLGLEAPRKHSFSNDNRRTWKPIPFREHSSWKGSYRFPCCLQPETGWCKITAIRPSDGDVDWGRPGYLRHKGGSFTSCTVCLLCLLIAYQKSPHSSWPKCLRHFVNMAMKCLSMFTDN